MEQTVSSYWWIIIPLALVFLALIFSLEKRGSRDKRRFPENYINGLRALIANDDDTAFVKLKQAVAEDTDNIDAYLKLGDLFRKRGQLEKAIRIHRELTLRKNIDSAMASLVRQSLATDYILSEKYDSALDILEKLVKDSSYRAWAQEKILEVYEKTGQWEKAFNKSKGLLKSKDQQKRLAIFRHLSGNDLFSKGEFHKARLAFKDALHYDEEFAPAYIMIAESYLAENRKRDAVEFFKKLAANVPNEAYQVVYKMEQTLFELGQFTEVETIYNNILQEHPDDTDILKSLAGIAEKKGDIQSAIDILKQAVSVNKDDVTAAAKLIEFYLNNGQKEKALEILHSGQEKWPSKTHQYSCPFCNVSSSRQELICPSCKRPGPYKRK